jgi:hypothetical protein
VSASLKMCVCGHLKDDFHVIPPHMVCGACQCNQFKGAEDYCDTHNKWHERLEDRFEHFREENADGFGCPHCYVTELMEA